MYGYVLPAIVLELVDKMCEQGRFPVVISRHSVPYVDTAPENLFHGIITKMLITRKREAALTTQTKYFFSVGKIYAAAITAVRIEQVQEGG
jgi:hypothetical protein